MIRVAQEGIAAGASGPMEVGGVRDTWTNIERSVVPTLKDGETKGWWDLTLYDQDKQALLNGGLIHMNFFGMDRDADSNKFQGYQAAVVWIEEPAPAADLSSGVSVKAFTLGISSLRQTGFKTSLQITMNPPDEDHWAITTPTVLQEKGLDSLRVETFWIPPGENRHLPKGYRERMRAAFEAAGQYDLVRRLVEGQIGSVQLGEAVTPGFSDLHIAKGPLPLSTRWKTYRGWDLWMNPAMCMVQVTPSGHVHVVGALQASGMGVEEFIQQYVLPWQTKFGILPPRPGAPDGFGRGPRAGFTIEDVIDPSGSTPDQSSSKRSARKIIELLLRTSCSPGPVAIDARVQSVNTLLGRMPGGRPMLQIDPVEGKPLIRALRGGWHRSRSNSGIIGPIVKSEACVDTETEMLTAGGWKSHEHLHEGETVYAYDMRVDRLRRVPLQAVHRYSGHHKVIRFSGTAIDAVVTPQHKMVCGHRWNQGIRFVRADELDQADHLLRVVPDGSQRKPWYTDDFIRACAWIMAEGTYRQNGAIQIGQSLTHNAAYCDELEALFLRLGGHRQKTDRDSFPPVHLHPCSIATGKMRHWWISGHTADAIRAVMPTKIVTPEFTARMTNGQRRLFLYEFVRGDGWWGRGDRGWCPRGSPRARRP